MKQGLTIATRGSRLAIRQAEIIEELLLKKFNGVEVEFLEVTTHGDIDQYTPLSGFGNSGVFVKSLEQKLLSNEADLAVHSLKDVPSEMHPDLVLAAFPQREDVRDVLVSRSGCNWRGLKPGSVVGTSSPARKEQFKLLRPDLIFKDIRGNVDTRVQKVLNGEFDATVLAAAGLKRLGYALNSESFFTPGEMVPSPGQGALVVQVLKNNREVLEMMKQINNEKVELQVTAERAFMAEIGGGCRFPVAAFAEFKGEKIDFRAVAHKPYFKNLEKICIEMQEKEVIERAKEIARELLKKNEIN